MLRIQTGARIASSASRRAKRLAAPSLVAHFSTSGSQSNVLQQIAEERQSESYEPFRKQYKDEQRKRRLEGIHKKSSTEISESTIANWELTVGLEVHAQLNTDHKLFSRMCCSIRGDDLTIGQALERPQPDMPIITLHCLTWHCLVASP